MSNAVATVSFLQGQAWAKAPDGTLRALTVGSTLNDDEILVTAQGARVELDVGSGEALVVNGGLEVGMSRDFLDQTATDSNEALLSDASVQEALTVLEQGGDLLEELEETAAGNTGGDGAEGHDFVQLTRIIETTDPQAFDFSSAFQLGQGAVEIDAGYVNRAPLVTDQVIASNEDEPATGQIIASDIEGDAMTFSIATPPANGTVVLDPLTGQFTFRPNANYNGTDGFVVTVTDSRGNSTNTTITLNIAPVNDAPTTNDISLTTDEDVPVNGQVVAQDIENDTLSYVVSGQPVNGTVVLDPATGTFVYTPNANYNGGDSFVVTISDGNGGTTTSLVTIGINPVNDGPVSNDQNLVTDEDTPINGQVVGSDVDGDSLGYSVSGQPANGTVSLNPATGGFVYTPNANYNGSDSFVVTISDGKGGTTTSRINIGINPVNDAPVSSDQNLTTPEDVALTGRVVATDIEGDTLAYAVSGQPANGSVSLNPATGGFVYTPNANYNGSDSFIVTISDGNGGTTTSRINIGVTPVNDAPVANNVNLTTPEDTPVSSQVSASDIDGDSLTFAVTGSPANGSVSLNPATGAFTYTPNANYNGSDSFVVTISDGKGGTTTSRINIGINPVNDAPVSSDQNLTTPEDVALTGRVVATDIEGDTLAYAVSGQPANGSVSLNPATGGFVYTPNANYNGSDSFVVTVSDGNGGTTTSRINIGVTPVNDAPVANNVNLTTPEDTPISSQVSASDVDGDSLTFRITGSPANGSVSLNPATGAFTYTPNANYNGSDSFVVTVSDGNGGTTTSLVSIGVTPVNDAPSAANLNLTTDEDVPVNGAISATDPDGDTLSYSVTGNPTHGAVVLNPATGTFTYTPNAGYGGGDSFVVTVSDGKGGVATSTVTIGVNALNDDPVASDLSLKTAEDTAVNGAISATDPESDPLSYSVTGNPANGTVVLNPSTGTFVYTPNANYNGNDSFVVTISDGKGGTTTSNVAIVVTPDNDGPVTVADKIKVAEGGTATLLDGTGATSVLANDTDPENNALTAVLVTGPSHGNLTLNADGTFSYTHDGSETTSDSFTYRANDGTSNGNLVTVQIEITPENDAPLAVNDAANVNEGSSVTVAVRDNDSDPESGALTVVSVSQGADGSVVIDAVTGNPIYTPNAGFSGNDSFTYTVRDPSGLTATATVNVVVKANAPSLLTADLDSAAEDNDVTGNVLTNDTDPDDTLTVASFQVAGLGSFSAGQTALIAGVGSLVVNTNGSYVFDPVANWNGAVPQVTYTTNTGFSSTLDITVTPVADAPVAVDDFYTINEDDVWSMPIAAAGLRANDSDPDGDAIRVSSVSNAANGTLSVVGGNLVFTPTAEFSGRASFDYFITDDKGGVDKGTVFIDVVAVNDPTQAIDDVKTVNEGNNATGNVLANDVDPDTTPQVASFVINGTTYTANDSVTLPGVGKFTLLANGDYTFEPIDNNFNGAVPTVTYRTDTGASADLDITLKPVNDAPVAVDDTFTITMNTTLSLPIPLAILATNDTDVDNDTLRVTTVTSEVNGTLQLVSGNLVFTPTPGFTGVASFTYVVTDDKTGFDSGRVTINVVAAPNQAPETNALNVSGDEDTLITINLAGSDSDGSIAGFVIKSLPANGLLYSDAAMTTLTAVDDFVTGPVYFKPDANWNGASEFNYTARDDKGLNDSTPARVNITVNPAADAAVLGSGAGTVKEDTPAQSTASGTLSITDPDTGEAGFQVQSNTAGTYGSFSITSGGDWAYNIDNSKSNVQQLKDGETKTETFAVKSIDGTATSVVITVTGTNDGPTAVADSGTTQHNTALTFTPAELLGNDNDPDGDTLGINSVQGAVNGTVSLVAGNAVFTPTAGYQGPASFTYTIIDGKGGSSTATVNVTVEKPNAAPVAVDDPASTQLSAGLPASVDLTWSQPFISSISASGGTLITSNADGVLGAMGVEGTGSTTEFDDEIQNGESILVTFNAPALSAYFGFAKLDFTGVLETGLWIAYLNGVEVGRGQFNPTDTTRTGTVDIRDISGNAVAFNQLKFDTAAAGSDYVVSWLTVGRNTATVQEGMSVSIPAGTGVLANDTDSDGGTLVVSAVRTGAEAGVGTDGTLGVALQGAYGKLTLNTDGSYSYTADNLAALHPGQIAKDYFTYTLSDGQGGTDKATLTISVFGAMGSDNQFYGTSGNNVLSGTSGADIISGAAGNDDLTGGLGADTFQWALADKGSSWAPATDVVQDFSRAQGDVLHLSELLQGENSSTLTNYLHFTYDAGLNQTTVHVSSGGGYSSGYNAGATDQIIVLNSLSVSGTNQEIINQLKASGNLITD